jgi:predicted metal-binding protein
VTRRARPASAPRDTLYVCRTCPREAWRAGGAAGEGERLAQGLRAALAQSPLGGRVDLLVVHCLGGCPKPCNVALTGAGKVYLRFNRLGEGDLAAVLALADRYASTRDGEVGERLPGELKGRLALRLAADIAPG